MIKNNQYSVINDCSEKKDKFANNVFCAASQFIPLDYLHHRIPLFWFAEEYIRTKVTRHRNDEYDELFNDVHTSKYIVTFVLCYTAAN